jgi:purine-cytosine permease-like protein
MKAKEIKNKKAIIIIGIIIIILCYFGYRNYLMIEEINEEYRIFYKNMK